MVVDRMSNKAIPFRPRLEGYFRSRFYTRASEINEQSKPSDIEKMITSEIQWVETQCNFNNSQRRRYRAIWLLLRDLIRSSWRACFRDGVLEMRLPSLDAHDINGASIPEVKALLRSWMQESRYERLVTYKDFVLRMEAPTQTRGDISQLIASGEHLADRLERVMKRESTIEQAVQPYLQLVTEGGRDAFTGLKLADIWRYFRLTWSTPAETTPGRTMQYLIRDAAHDKHAIMGIASFENSAVQITCRDEYIGWNPSAFIEKIRSQSEADVRARFEGLLGYIEDGIGGIDSNGLCSSSDINDPSDELIKELQQRSLEAEEERQSFLKAQQSENNVQQEEKSELGKISKDAEGALYRRKRAEQLYKLLSAKKALTSVIESSHFDQVWRSFIESEAGYSAIRTALVAQKAKHIGSSMMELNVCGAIPPYNELLGGKLVALLALSPQVVMDYKHRYQGRQSEIASRLKGSAVCRAADLVYIGTTSLYHVGSSQYNRLSIPKQVLNSDYDLQWKQLGLTIGFGTMHISKATTMSLNEVASEIGFSRINHVFGEGSSPKLRLITMAVRELLETAQDDARELAKHAMSRIVYGVSLAKNTKEYMLGLDSTPEYYFEGMDVELGTQRIIDYWRTRWVKSRLSFPPLLDRLREFEIPAFLVSNEFKRTTGWKFEKLKEGNRAMSMAGSEKAGLSFVRQLYRGSSAFADYTVGSLLDRIHVTTSLDNAVYEAVQSGKDVILTGNPGDGKTHLIRILKDKLEGLGQPPHIELDASCLSNDEIIDRWILAHERRAPFVIAINAAVLFSLADQYPQFHPIAEAAQQMINSIVYGPEQPNSDNVALFDLSKREVLVPEVVVQAIARVSHPENFTECESCHSSVSCEALKNVRLLNASLFQERLCHALSRVALQGHHATLRELLSFISYLIFGDRSCSKMVATTGDNSYDIVNLIYSGSGALFDAIRLAFDPACISHPLWDELLLTNAIPPASWTAPIFASNEAIDVSNDLLFRLRKRQFFFFNENGDALLNISDDDVSRFQQFLAQDDKKSIKDLIKKLNAFFGVTRPSAELEVWGGHRFNNSPRKVLISVGKMSASQFTIGRPTLSRTMARGIKMVIRHVHLEKKGKPGIFLKVDFALYCLLLEAERGVPMLFMENDIVKRVWRFIEQLQAMDDVKGKDEVVLSLLDVQGKKEFRVLVDREARRYLSIEHRISLMQ